MATGPDSTSTLQKLSGEFQKLQQDLQGAVSARQKLTAQEQENLNVKKEFDSHSESDPSQIYKLIGPVLLKQDRTEATMAVDGRLDYIGKEIKRVESQISELQSSSESKKMEIYDIQTQAQQAQQEAQAQV